jgi:DNA polymerase-3 subunit epsilon/ATP-dependent DNA helicase DinG
VYQQRNQCFLFRARRDAENAHLVVANHALLLSDTIAGSHVLPPYEHLVVDEAHHLEDQATTHFGFTVDERMVQDILDAIVRLDGAVRAGALPQARAYIVQAAENAAGNRRAEAAGLRASSIEELVATARNQARHLFLELDSLVDNGATRGGYGRTIRLTSGLRAGPAWSDFEIAWDYLDQSLTTIESELRWFLDAIEAAEPEPGTPPEDPRMRQFEDISSALISAIRGGADVAAQLKVAMTSAPNDLVTWLERSPVQGRLGLHAAPLRVDALLQEQLFGRLRTAVLTSATLATDGSFEFMADRLGLEDAHELLVPSPFDYASSTLLYLASDVVEPNHPHYQQQIHQSLIATCSATRGRALVLFTSHAALQAAYRAIKQPLEHNGIVVLAQRTDGSPRQLIERLRHSSDTVVLGTASFWEGIDVAGDALSLLVITKLPFSVPSDPIFAARGELIEEEGGQSFMDYAVPTAVLKFKQGFGRLIRSSQDRGVCAVLDRRVISKRYGRSFVESLPECALTVGSVEDLPAAAARWIDE